MYYFCNALLPYKYLNSNTPVNKQNFNKGFLFAFGRHVALLWPACGPDLANIPYVPDVGRNNVSIWVGSHTRRHRVIYVFWHIFCYLVGSYSLNVLNCALYLIYQLTLDTPHESVVRGSRVYTEELPLSLGLKGLLWLVGQPCRTKEWAH